MQGVNCIGYGLPPPVPHGKMIPMSEAEHSPSKVGARIRLVRVAHKLSQSQFADLCGLNLSAIGNWEQGRQRPSIDASQKISDAFGLTLDYLLLGRLGTLKHDVATRLIESERSSTSESSDTAA